MSRKIITRCLALGLLLGMPLITAPITWGSESPTPEEQAARTGFWRWVDWGQVRSRRRRAPRNLDGIALYLFTPRNTTLLPGQAISFWWAAVPAAPGYRVTVLDGSEPIWVTVVPGTRDRVDYSSPPSGEITAIASL